jgi:hypothetical protein
LPSRRVFTIAPSHSGDNYIGVVLFTNMLVADITSAQPITLDQQDVGVRLAAPKIRRALTLARTPVCLVFVAAPVPDVLQFGAVGADRCEAPDSFFISVGMDAVQDEDQGTVRGPYGVGESIQAADA